MAFKTISQFMSLWINGFIPNGVHYDDVWDSHEKASRVTTLDASGETSMRVKFQGDTTPTLAKEANGEYLLTIGARTGQVAFSWTESGGTLTGSNSLKLKIRDIAGYYLSCTINVHSLTTGDEYSQAAGVTVKRTRPIAGTTLTEIANVGNVPGDWLIIGTVI